MNLFLKKPLYVLDFLVAIMKCIYMKTFQKRQKPKTIVYFQRGICGTPSCHTVFCWKKSMECIFFLIQGFKCFYLNHMFKINTYSFEIVTYEQQLSRKYFLIVQKIIGWNRLLVIYGM